MPPGCKTILVINPNTSKHMTDNLKSYTVREASKTLRYAVHLDFYTAPSGPASINNEDDALESAKVVIADLRPQLKDYDGFLVACYSVHPLVDMIRMEAPHARVVGIFEASITMALSFLSMNSASKFGIVSTGTYWEKALSDGVQRFLGTSSTTKFGGVQTTGLSASELHSTDQDVVHKKMTEAALRLIDGGVEVICLGCAGMAGMDAILEMALQERLGREALESIQILDGVVAGIGMMEGMLRSMPSKELDPAEFKNPALRVNQEHCYRTEDPCC